MNSLNDHVSLTETPMLGSRLAHRGKGREGNKEGKGGCVAAFHHASPTVTRAAIGPSRGQRVTA